MVALPDDYSAELAALIRSQERDDALYRVRKEGGRIENGHNLDALPGDVGGVRLLEGRPQHWQAEEAPYAPCSLCRNSPGFAVCLKCGRDETGIAWRGKPVDESAPGPTSYDPAASGGLKGGRGR